MLFRRISITIRTTLFVTLVCLSLVAVDMWHSWNARAQHLHDVNDATSNLARAMAQHADDTLKAADSALVSLIERLDVDGRSPAALARLHAVLVQQVAQLDQLNGLFVYDADGRWLVNSRPLPVAPLNNADRAYFVYHRSHPQRGPHVGAPLRSRATGQWVIPLSRRLEAPDGSFAGVALATIDMAYFQKFYATFDIGARGAVALLADDGILLMRRPFSEQSMGKSVRANALFRAYDVTGRPGAGLFRSGQDGELRLNSYRPLQHYPLFVTAAVSYEEMLEQWQRNTLIHLGGVLALCALMGFFGWRLIAQIRLRAAAESQLVAARDALATLNTTLEKQAMQDGLTGLANRRQLDVTLGNEFSRARRAGSTLACVMLDVDFFKQYNDRYGHAAGDECLRLLAKTILRLTPNRPGDLAARYGGEEIMLLLPNTQLAGALAVAEKIRLAIAGLDIVHADSPYGVVTLSAGVAALRPQRNESLPGVLAEAADHALYAAKKGGRNRVESAPAAGPDRTQ